MIKIYDKDLLTFQEVDDTTFNELLENDSIEVKERFVAHHTIPEEEKRAAKTAEEVYEELLAQGVEVKVHRGIYCKVVDKTYEAINSISAIDDYDEFEEVYAYKE